MLSINPSPINYPLNQQHHRCSFTLRPRAASTNNPHDSLTGRDARRAGCRPTRSGLRPLVAIPHLRRRPTAKHAHHGAGEARLKLSATVPDRLSTEIQRFVVARAPPSQHEDEALPAVDGPVLVWPDLVPAEGAPDHVHLAYHLAVVAPVSMGVESARLDQSKLDREW